MQQSGKDVYSLKVTGFLLNALPHTAFLWKYGTSSNLNSEVTFLFLNTSIV